MLTRRALVTILALAGFAAAATFLPHERHASPMPTLTQAQERLPEALSDSAYGRLIQRISEPGGYFDTDNIISNEASYLHVIGKMRALNVVGGAYLGVGPDQNFSYITAIRPRIAFILDIRRDNLLEHFLFKALMQKAPTRIEYLCLLFGRQPPRDPSTWHKTAINDLVEYVDVMPPDRKRFDATSKAVVQAVQHYGLPLSEEDLATVIRLYATFFDAGLELRYASHGRPPRASYPTYRQLLLETDRAGHQDAWLATEDGYQYLRTLETKNLLIPVTGDFAGDHALREIGAYLRERGESLSAFYLSNVEFYLWQDRVFDRFAQSVATLPFNDRTVMIRSLFGRIYGHPQAVPGYYSTQLLQNMSTFVEEFRSGGYATYGDLVYKKFIDLR